VEAGGVNAADDYWRSWKLTARHSQRRHIADTVQMLGRKLEVNTSFDIVHVENEHGLLICIAPKTVVTGRRCPPLWIEDAPE